MPTGRAIAQKPSPAIELGASSRRAGVGDGRFEGDASTRSLRAVNTTTESTLGYRPDIDGLRGLAVILVVAYHFGIAPIRGGFIGVDIFFVISGFLITELIVRDVETSRFSIADFYRRRIRRIIPALTVMLVAVAAASLWLQFPTETRETSNSLAAATLFVSNLYYLSTAQYFAGGAEATPLLHTWSLAIEEQFYLFYPLLLLVIIRSGSVWRQRAVALVGIVALASFGLSVWLAQVHQEDAFYLMSARAWELAAGALLALGTLPRLRTPILVELTGIAGLLLILAAAVIYHKGLHFPGAWALAPVTGAAALIYAGSCRTTRIARVMGSWPIRGIGLFSYSLYLWHWPVIVFWRDATGHDPSLLSTVALFLASMILATLSWWLIERPFRDPRSLVARHPWSSVALVAAAALGFLAVAHATGGWPSRYTSTQLALTSYLDFDDAAIYRRGTCFIDSHLQGAADFDRARCLAVSSTKPNILLIGDSHAAHLWPALQQSYPQYNVLQVTASGCKPVSDTKGERACVDLMREAFSTVIPNSHLDAIIFAARWEISDVAPLKSTVSRYVNSGPKLYVVGPIMTYATPLPRLLAQAQTRGPAIVAAARAPEFEAVDAAFASAFAGTNAIYVSYRSLACAGPTGCLTQTPDGVPLQWDYGHLTREGGLLIAAAMKSAGVLQ